MELIEKLKYYDDLYFNSGTSPITDTEYDLLKSAALKKYPNHPYFLSVGAPIKSEYSEVKLPYILGGLDKVDIETLQGWLKDKKEEIVISEKLDGISIVCTWESGKLIFAATRGDGQTGQDILNKAKYFIPDIPIKEKITLRGEILLLGNWHKYLKFKNRRNGVAGLIRRDDINPKDLSLLTAFFYELVDYINIPNTEYERLLFIQKLNLSTPIFFKCKKGDNDLENTLQYALFDFKQNADYDIDGLVISINESSRENVMHPKNKVKFKVNELAKKCNVLNIEWNVTRTGYVKPVILINPTEIMGVTVSRVSGFNYEYIKNKNIGKNSVIGVVRSGDVIPYVTEVFEESDDKDMIIPDKCPSCNNALRIISKELICDNDNCTQKNIYIVSHFFISMGVDNMSDKTIKNIEIAKIEEMYELTKENLEKIPGFGSKKAENVINEIQKTLTTKPENLLAAFGMPLIGRTISKQLCSRFKFDDLFDITNPNDLDLGPITSSVFIENIGKYKKLYEYLKSKGLKFVEEDMSTKTLNGIIFTLTGDGPLKRKDIQKMIEGRGGQVKGICKETKFLVTNDMESTSGKMKKAIEYGTKIISYDDLMKDHLKV